MSGVAAWMALRPSPELHRSVFGVTSRSAVESAIDAFCTERLGAGVAEISFYWVSTGAVAGVELDDGRRLVCKFVARDLERLDVLEACRRVQAHARAAGLPVPAAVLRPVAWNHAVVTVDEWLPSPPPLDARQPAVRAGLATLLWRLTDCLRDINEPALAGSRYRSPEIPPTCGLAEFDGPAATSHATIRNAVAERRISHIDWRSQDAHVDDAGGPVAIYDWDAVTIDTEESFVGTAAAMLSVVFAAPNSSVPTPSDVAAFVADYEAARGRAFDRAERKLIAAAVVYKLARHATIEVALDPNEEHIDDRSIRRALRAYGAAGYQTAL